MTLKQRLLPTYRVLQPGRDERYVCSWFRTELRKHGIERSRVTVSVWLHGRGQPSDPEAVEGVVRVLEADAEIEATRRYHG